MKSVELKEALHTKRPLRFRADGKFRILMVSDVHGGVGYDAEHTIAALQGLIDRAKPDLVLLGGDNAGPGKIHIETAEQLREMLDGLSSPMERAGIPWAHVFGNHDDNFGLENDEQEPVYESYAHCVSKAGPDDVDGSGNYVLPLLAADGDRIVFNVFGLDTHRGISEYKQEKGFPEDMEVVLPNRGGIGSGEDGLRTSQIRWFIETSELLDSYNGSKIPALAFMHVPLPELALVDMNREECGFSGERGEDVACPSINSGFFRVCMELGNVKTMCFGHDHENNFIGEYCGIKLCYDGHLSYHASHNELTRGGRIFDIDASDPWNIKTEIILLK